MPQLTLRHSPGPREWPHIFGPAAKPGRMPRGLCTVLGAYIWTADLSLGMSWRVWQAPADFTACRRSWNTRLPYGHWNSGARFKKLLSNWSNLLYSTAGGVPGRHYWALYSQEQCCSSILEFRSQQLLQGLNQIRQSEDCIKQCNCIKQGRSFDRGLYFGKRISFSSALNAT